MTAKIFHVEYDTKDMAPRIVAVRLHIDGDNLKLDKEVLRKVPPPGFAELYNHPLYPALVRYVMANSPKVQR